MLSICTQNKILFFGKELMAIQKKAFENIEEKGENDETFNLLYT